MDTDGGMWYSLVSADGLAIFDDKLVKVPATSREGAK